MLALMSFVPGAPCRGINVNSIAADPFQSKMMKVTLERFGDTIRASTLVGRIGDAGDVGGTCIFLAARAGQWITGVTLPVDGGVLVKPKL